MIIALLLACPGKRLGGDDPSGEELFTRYTEALLVGDDSAWDRSQRRVDHGTFSMPRQGITSSLEARYERPDHFVVRMDFPGIGLFEEGYDGELGWAVDPTQGPRVKDPEESLRFAFDAAYEGDLNWEERYTEFRVMGLETCQDQPAWEVRAVTVLGDERTLFFDKKTGLMTCSVIEVKGGFGSVKTRNQYLDYEEVEGRLVSRKLIQEAMMLELVLESDVIDLSPREFEPIAPPPEVAELLP